MEFFVEFTPTEKRKIPAELRLTVVDNPFEDTVIKLLGEGFEEEVTLDNIHGGIQDVPFAEIEDDDYAGNLTLMLLALQKTLVFQLWDRILASCFPDT